MKHAEILVLRTALICFALLIFNPKYSICQTVNEISQQLYDDVELTGEKVKEFFSIPVTPLIDAEESSGVPTWIWIGAGAGGATIIYLITQGGDSTVVSQGPTALNDMVSISCSSSANINVLSNDSGNAIELVSVEPVSGVSIDHNANGTISISDITIGSFNTNYTISDADGNSATATLAVTVQFSALNLTSDDIEFETAVPISVNILANDTGDNLQVISHTEATNGIVSISSDGLLSYTSNADYCGAETISYTVTDACAQEATGQINLHGLDNTAPEISCPSDIVIECSDSSDPSNTGEATASDDCSETEQIQITMIDDLGALSSCNNTGTITRTWTATDAAGNSSTCEQQIQVEDSSGPSISCPSDVTIECHQINDLTIAGEAEATDMCGAVDIQYTDDFDPTNDCSSNVTFQRMWTATDSCGNTTVCMQMITIQEDTTAPVISCASEATVNCGDSTDPEIIGQVTVSDNCSGQDAISLSFEDSDPVVDNCTLVSVRSWTAVDACGNTSTCEQMITQNDTAAPIISCPSDVTIENDDSQHPSSNGFAEATDDCSAELIDIDWSDDFDESGGGGGILTRTWTAVDACGNSSSCVQTIEVEDIPCELIDDVDVIPITCNTTGDVIVELDSAGDGPMDIIVFLPGGDKLDIIEYPNNSDFILSEFLPDLIAGEYVFVITDQSIGKACMETFAVLIEQFEPPFIEILDIVQPSSPTANDGQIFVQVLDDTGIPPFTVFVNDMQIGVVAGSPFVINGVSVGEYLIFLSDAFGCFSNELFVFVNSNNLTLSSSVSVRTEEYALQKNLEVTEIVNSSEGHSSTSNSFNVHYSHITRLPSLDFQYVLEPQFSLNFKTSVFHGNAILRHDILTDIEARFNGFNFSPFLRWHALDRESIGVFVDSGADYTRHEFSETNSKDLRTHRIESISALSPYVNLGLNFDLAPHSKIEMKASILLENASNYPFLEILYQTNLNTLVKQLSKPKTEILNY